MKSNFNEAEILTVFGAFNNKFDVRVNKAGNINLVYRFRTNPDEHFVLYYTQNKKYLWRRHIGNGYCYPLNMVNRKRTGPIHKDIYNGKPFYWYTRRFDINDCEFETVNDAVNYFRNYLRKYRRIIC